MSVLFVCGLLLVGVLLRAAVRPIRTLFIPASVVGGLIGLAVIQAGLHVGEAPVKRVDLLLDAEYGTIGSGLAIHDDRTTFRDNGSFTTANNFADDLSFSVHVEGRAEELGLGDAPSLPTEWWAARISNIIDGWPGLLIAVVFAGLLIERPGKRFSQVIVTASRAGIAAWIIIVGQIFLGLLITALLVAPFYDVPPTFGQLIEVGMAGGFGTATAMGEVYRNQGLVAGRDLGYFFATFGLLWGTLSGIVLINIAIRRGWVTPRGPQYPAAGSESASARTPIGLARIRPEIIDPLAFQLCLLAAAFGIGYAMQQAFLWVVAAFALPQTMQFIGNIPLFLFTLLGGWTLREAMHLAGIGHLIDSPSINRLCGIAMEILIVSALATLRIEAAAQYLWPVLLLLLVGCAWCIFCLLWLSRRLLPKDYWFELGLINYGMSTGTTAQGLMLLRIVDPDLESGAAEDYAAAAPLSAPFIGGGVLTVLGIPLALGADRYWPVIAACGVVMAGLYIVGRMLAKATMRGASGGGSKSCRSDGNGSWVRPGGPGVAKSCSSCGKSFSYCGRQAIAPVQEALAFVPQAIAPVGGYSFCRSGWLRGEALAFVPQL